MVRVRKQPTRCDLSEKAIGLAKNLPQYHKDDDYELYQKWVKSKGFKALRVHMLERDNYRCRFCGRTQEELVGTKISLQAHHSTYAHVGLGDERELDDLITTCSVCHRGCHSAKSNLRRFTDKSAIRDNLKENPDMECRIDKENPLISRQEGSNNSKKL